MAQTRKRKIGEEPAEEQAKKPEKVKKTAKKNRAKKTLDPEVVELFRKLSVPLELVAKHGASFESQAKRAVKEVYDGGRTHRKNVNPLRAAGMLSHTMTVSGIFAKKFKCN